MNYKRKKTRFKKLYRNGIDGVGCGYCGSNWTFANSIKLNAIKWELLLEGTDSND